MTKRIEKILFETIEEAIEYGANSDGYGELDFSKLYDAINSIKVQPYSVSGYSVISYTDFSIGFTKDGQFKSLREAKKFAYGINEKHKSLIEVREEYYNKVIFRRHGKDIKPLLKIERG